MSEARENENGADPDTAVDSELSLPPPAIQTYEDKNEVVEDLLHRVEDYSSVISDSVTNSILQGVGVDNQTPEVTRLISLAAQKFISDISYEALQHCKMRGGGKEQKSKSSGRDRKYAMSTEDVVVALSDQGLTVKKPPYFSS